jgi:hypothetical protein
VFDIHEAGDLLPGDIGFTTIPGRLGAWVSAGQALLRDECWFTHTYIVAEVPGDGTAWVVEAMPNGARSIWMEDGGVGKNAFRAGRGYGWARLPLTIYQRASIVEYAKATIGTPYSFLDYASLALLHMGLPRKLVRSRVADSGHMICSQLVDHVLCQAGFHLFTDGRLSQDVTPGALFRRAGALGQVQWD